MRNRAKCKLCGDILESFHRHDFVACKCGEISIDGGNDYLYCGAKNWENFRRIDDQGNEIVVKVSSEPETQAPLQPTKPTKNEMIEMLDAMIKKIEELPQNAMSLPISHYDLYTYMLLISQILKS